MPQKVDTIERIMNTAAGAAALNHYPFTERLPLWRERLVPNGPELEHLDALTDGGPCQYLPPPTVPGAGGVPPAPDTPGICEIARETAATGRDISRPARQALERAARHRDLNAFTQLSDENGLERQTAEIASAAASGSAMPLLGVPIAVKDLMAVKGFRLTGGSKPQASASASDHDALAVARLREAGAIIPGVANLHELAYGITSANPHFGPVANPCDRAFTPGGSSGGSAAAVAAGIVRGALGTDTSGSIRIPASCCGVVGFKPSYDAIPRQGAMDLGPTLDHLGPIAQSVDDAALLFSIMAGQPAQIAKPLGDLRGLRIGLPRRYFFDPLAADVRRALDRAMRLIEADGATFSTVDIPGVEHSSAIQFATLCSEATAVHWRRLVETPDSLGEDVRVRLEIGQLFPAVWYARAQGARARLAAAMDGVLADVDVLLTPTLRTTAPPCGAATVAIDHANLALHTAMTNLTLPFNLTGMPAISLPCGHGDHDLPVGLQIAGGRGSDWKVLAAAARVETLLQTLNRS